VFPTLIWNGGIIRVPPLELWLTMNDKIVQIKNGSAVVSDRTPTQNNFDWAALTGLGLTWPSLTRSEQRAIEVRQQFTHEEGQSTEVHTQYMTNLFAGAFVLAIDSLMVKLQQPVAAPNRRPVEIDVKGRYVEIQKQPNINTEHVFNGEINSSGRSVGFHHEGIEHSNLDSRVTRIISPPNAKGVYEATVEEFNSTTQEWVPKIAKSTMFPKAWSRQQIIGEIRSAYNNQIPVSGPAAKWAGWSSRGLKIQGYLDLGAVDSINTAYPVYS
jgi:hypothetical protein